MHTYMSKTGRVLRYLKSQGSATNRELNRICFRYGARIYELRREGHIIRTSNLGSGLFSFHYMGHKDDDEEQPERDWDDVAD